MMTLELSLIKMHANTCRTHMSTKCSMHEWFPSQSVPCDVVTFQNSTAQLPFTSYRNMFYFFSTVGCLVINLCNSHLIKMEASLNASSRVHIMYVAIDLAFFYAIKQTVIQFVRFHPRLGGKWLSRNWLVSYL